MKVSAPKRPSMGTKELKGLGLVETSSESRRKESLQSSASTAKAAAAAAATTTTTTTTSSSKPPQSSQSKVSTQKDDDKPKTSRTSCNDVSMRELQNLFGAEIVLTSRRPETTSAKAPDAVVVAKSSQLDVSKSKESNSKNDTTRKETSIEKSWENITPTCECGKTYALPQGLYNHRKTCKLWKGHQHILSSAVNCNLPTTTSKSGKVSNDESNEEVKSAKRKAVDVEENDKKKSKVEKQPRLSVGAKELRGLGLEPASSQSSNKKQSSQSSSSTSSSSKPSQSKPNVSTQKDDESKHRNPTEISMRELKNLMGADVVLSKRRKN